MHLCYPYQGYGTGDPCAPFVFPHLTTFWLIHTISFLPPDQWIKSQLLS